MDAIVPGALAAFTVDTLVYPLDTLKTRVQATDYAERFPGRQGLYKGLWNGLGPVILVTLPSAALFFTCYEGGKAAFTSPSLPLVGHLTSQPGNAQAVAHSLAGALAELASCALLAPAELVKQRRQVAVASSSSTSASPAKVLTRTLREQSRTLWKSYLALAGRNLPFTALQFPLYEHVRHRLAGAVGLPERGSGPGGRTQVKPTDGMATRAGSIDAETAAARADVLRKMRPDALAQDERLQKEGVSHYYLKAGLVSGSSAALAGSVAALVTTPLDVAKTRIMLHSTTKASSASHYDPSTQGVLRLLVRIAREEGLKALFRGGSLRCAWTALGAGIYLGSYETGREWWRESGRQQAKAVVHEVEEKVDTLTQS